MRVDLALLGDYALVDKMDKLSVAGIFRALVGFSFPMKHAAMFLALALTVEAGDGVHHSVVVRLINPDGQDVIPQMRGEFDIQRPDPAAEATVNLILEFNDVVFRGPGTHCFEAKRDSKMTKDLAYYQTLPYEREWLPRDDESGRYFVVRLRDIPQIYGTGDTRQKALAQLRTAFDEQIAWCIEEVVQIPEPSTSRPSQPKTLEITVERIETARLVEARQVDRTGVPQTQSATASYRTSRPIDVAEFELVA